MAARAGCGWSPCGRPGTAACRCSWSPASFALELAPGTDAPLGAPGLLEVDGRTYELVFLGRSGEPFPSGVELNALVPGLEPMDPDLVDADVWAVLEWLVGGAGWSVPDLRTTGAIYRVPGSGS